MDLQIWEHHDLSFYESDTFICLHKHGINFKVRKWYLLFIFV